MTSVAQSSALERLRAEIDGRVIDPSEPDYDAARTVFPGDVDRRPAAIVRPAGTDEVARAVAIARDSELPLSVRGGGHSSAGHSLVDGGITIDLSEMCELEIDADGRAAWAQAGLTAGEYTKLTGERGLVTGFGDTGTVGIGGITLGGGVGFLSRAHGLTIDNLLAAEIVTADGEVREIDAEREPDLFWAIRGGGGNFGVVTRFKYRLRELPEVVGGMMMLPASAEVVRDLVAAAEAAPEELSVIASVMPAPPMPLVPEEHRGKLSVMALVCFAGPAAEGELALQPFRSLAEPLVDMVRPMPYADIFGPEPEGFHPTVVVRNSYVDRIDLDAAAAIVDRVSSSDAPMRAVQFRILGGAIDRVPADATAYAHRGERIMVNVVSMYGGEADRPTRAAWVDDLSATIGANGRAYVNFLADEGIDRVRAAYPGETWTRLVEVKRRYDPDNLFSSNQNVPPN